MSEQLLDIESKVSDATLDIKKATAIFLSMLNDMRFEKTELNEDDLHYIAYAFENISHKGLAVMDYLHSCVDTLDSIHI